jgi:hypothetical protein
MSWHISGRNAPCYYQHIRQGDLVNRVYVGRGPEAHRLAREVEQRRQDRLARREAYLGELTQLAPAEEALRELRRLANLMVKAVLLTSGCYQHHGQWRRRHGNDAQRNRTS